MPYKIKIIPRFRSKKILHEGLGAIWFEFQDRIWKLGKGLHQEMKSYITTHTRRHPASGKLASAINFDRTTGAGTVGFTIGNVEKLSQEAPYWYVVNFGKKTSGEQFIPGGGKFRPVRYNGNSPTSEMRGRGTERASQIGRISHSSQISSPIRPMNYISHTRKKMREGVAKIIKRLRAI